MTAGVDFYYDYASPWSYVANAIFAREVPGATATLKPIYLRGLPVFSGGLPYDHVRLRYIGADLLRCTKRHGVELQFPSVFPINGIHALRAMMWTQAHEPPRAAELHARLFRSAWAENRDLADRAVVEALAAELGLKPQLDDPAIKDALKAQTVAARERGVFGVPSFFLGAELFFGHDRLDYLRESVAVRQA